ncbi:MAG TPA: CBS domain-containing protein [Azospirillaceae bacterium]|nr:CBS domain-containing protein [Azospirillaceae bacterium]
MTNAQQRLIRDVMTRDAQSIGPNDSIQRAAQLMDQLNVGALPVCEGERLIGMVTDRDITVRATAAGHSPTETRVDAVMSGDVRSVGEDDTLETAARIMRKTQIRRLPVVGADNRLVGIVALGDIATDAPDMAEETLRQVSEPSEPDRS